MTTGGDIIYGGASGTGTRLANGTSGQVLTSAGTTAAPTWETPSGGGSAEAIICLSLSSTTATFTTTFVTCVFDATEYTSGTGDFTISSGVITVVNAGTYEISYDVSIDENAGNNRTEFMGRLYDGTAEYVNTRSFTYSRNNAAGAGTGSCRTIKTLSSSDTIELQAARNKGAGTGEFLGDGCRITVRKIST